MQQLPRALQRPIRPMTARPVAHLPNPDRAGAVALEPKLDGFRAIAVRTGGRATLQSRQQRSLSRYFPEIVAGLLEQLPDGTVVDGELVLWNNGRLDFAALQRRIHPSALHAARRGIAQPASLVVFDLLALGAEDLRRRPYRERRALLERLLQGVRAPLALMPATRDVVGAAAWMTEHLDAGVEGVVIKPLDHAYLPERRRWDKCRARHSVEALVGGVFGPVAAPHALVLGLYDEWGHLTVAGRTVGLTPAARHEVGAVLTPARQPHPWPVRISSARWGQLPPELVTYTPVDPRVVVELDADHVFEYGRWRHPLRFSRIRAELHPQDLSPIPERHGSRQPPRNAPNHSSVGSTNANTGAT